jgi:hypothetical protein
LVDDGENWARKAAVSPLLGCHRRELAGTGTALAHQRVCPKSEPARHNARAWSSELAQELVGVRRAGRSGVGRRRLLRSAQQQRVVDAGR